MANPAILAFRDPATHGRPLPLRTYSECETMPAEFDPQRAQPHSRNKSMSANLTRLTVPTTRRQNPSGSYVSPRMQGHDYQEDGLGLVFPTDDLTPPSTPEKSRISEETCTESLPEILDYDFSQLDYELDRAKILGSGLWSDVFLAEPIVPQQNRPSPTLLTPPVTPQKVPQSSRPNLFAVKFPTRPDSVQVFSQEAKILTHIHRHPSADFYIVPFHGLDARNNALVFSALQSGSLQDVINRLSHMTEVSRHQELVTFFPTLAHDLASGLDFLHNAADVVHADIKPANVLLSPSPSPAHPTRLQARYADFSASFLASSHDPATNTTAAGGTWTYLAPEQLRRSTPTEPNLPTFASDVWSLGLTLLSLIILGSPYVAACGDNAFRLREGIKAGDPLGFAVMDHVARKRMQACQGFVDCCRLGLQKDVSRRVGARAWRAWMFKEGLGV